MATEAEPINKLGKILVGLLLGMLLFHIIYAATHSDNFVRYLVSANTLLRLGEIFIFCISALIMIGI